MEASENATKSIGIQTDNSVFVVKLSKMEKKRSVEIFKTAKSTIEAKQKALIDSTCDAAYDSDDLGTFDSERAKFIAEISLCEKWLNLLLPGKKAAFDVGNVTSENIDLMKFVEAFPPTNRDTSNFDKRYFEELKKMDGETKQDLEDFEAQHRNESSSDEESDEDPDESDDENSGRTTTTNQSDSDSDSEPEEINDDDESSDSEVSDEEAEKQSFSSSSGMGDENQSPLEPPEVAKVEESKENPEEEDSTETQSPVESAPVVVVQAEVQNQENKDEPAPTVVDIKCSAPTAEGNSDSAIPTSSDRIIDEITIDDDDKVEKISDVQEEFIDVVNNTVTDESFGFQEMDESFVQQTCSFAHEIEAKKHLQDWEKIKAITVVWVDCVYALKVQNSTVYDLNDNDDNDNDCSERDSTDGAAVGSPDIICDRVSRRSRMIFRGYYHAPPHVPGEPIVGGPSRKRAREEAEARARGGSSSQGSLDGWRIAHTPLMPPVRIAPRPEPEVITID